MNREKRIALTTPGEILSDEFLKPYNLKEVDVALDISIHPSRLSEIIHGKRAISMDTARRFARYFGTTPQFWLNLQNNYDLQKAEEDGSTTAIKRIVPLRRQKRFKKLRQMVK